jgi:hypothetical protein
MHRDKSARPDLDQLKTGNSSQKFDMGAKLSPVKSKQDRRKFSDLTDNQNYLRESQEVSHGAVGGYLNTQNSGFDDRELVR